MAWIDFAACGRPFGLLQFHRNDAVCCADQTVRFAGNTELRGTEGGGTKELGGRILVEQFAGRDTSFSARSDIEPEQYDRENEWGGCHEEYIVHFPPKPTKDKEDGRQEECTVCGPSIAITLGKGPPLLRRPGVRFDLQLAGDSRDRGTLDVLQVPRLRTVHEFRELSCRNQLVACPHGG